MWKEIEKNMVWSLDHFFSPETLQLLDCQINSQLERSHVKSDKLCDALVSQSKFHYQMLTLNIDSGDLVRKEVLNRLLSEDSPIEMNKNLNGLNKVSQAMIKFFGPDSKYELHTEEGGRFGNWVYVVYLSNESSGEILFPSEEWVSKMDVNCEEFKNWEIMKQSLEKKDQSVFYASKDLSLMPKKNRAILFRVGLAHKVFPIDGNEIGRFCLTGWPFASIN